MEALESWFTLAAGVAALSVELLAVLVIVVGAGQALMGLARMRRDPLHPLGHKRDVWLRFSGWLLLGLEFTLAADIIRTAIAPSWSEIGMLAAIAVIRTFLNYFLEHDFERIHREPRSRPGPRSSRVDRGAWEVEA